MQEGGRGMEGRRDRDGGIEAGKAGGSETERPKEEGKE